MLSLPAGCPCLLQGQAGEQTTKRCLSPEEEERARLIRVTPIPDDFPGETLAPTSDILEVKCKELSPGVPGQRRRDTQQPLRGSCRKIPSIIGSRPARNPAAQTAASIARL